MRMPFAGRLRRLWYRLRTLGLDLYISKPTNQQQLMQQLAVSSPALQVLVVPAGLSTQKVFGGALCLDTATLANLYKALGPVGAIPVHSGARIVQGLAKRVSQRLAKIAAPNDPEKAAVLAAAWMFPIWRELCTLVPARHLARKIAREQVGKLIVIPLRTTTFSYLNYFRWDARDDELEPLILAHALRKRGANVLLIASKDQFAKAERKSGVYSLRVEPFSIWNADEDIGFPTASNGSVVVADGIRNYPYVQSHFPEAIPVRSLLAGAKDTAQIRLWERQNNPLSHHIGLSECVKITRGVRLYSIVGASENLGQSFTTSILPTSEKALETAQLCAEQLNLKDAHICDHPFFESAFIAHAVNTRGGNVHLWPHSINHTFLNLHQWGRAPASLTTVTQSAAQCANRMFDGVDIRVCSEIMLKPRVNPQPFVAGQPITLVFFGGDHLRARLPVLDVKRHEALWVNLLGQLSAYPNDFKVIFKGKGQLESAKWLSGLCHGPAPFEETLTPTNDLAYPNMIFMSVSLASAAQIEGLGRGVPCMIARNMPIEDYLDINQEVVPVADVPEIISELFKCRDPQYLQALTQKQLSWYADETKFRNAYNELKECQ